MWIKFVFDDRSRNILLIIVRSFTPWNIQTNWDKWVANMQINMRINHGPTIAPFRWCYAMTVPSLSRGWLNIKMSSYQYRKSHCGDETILRSSHRHNGISYTGKMTSLYWIRAQDDIGANGLHPEVSNKTAFSAPHRPNASCLITGYQQPTTAVQQTLPFWEHNYYALASDVLQ